MKQREIPYLGALYEIIGRLTLVIGILNYIMLSFSTYEGSKKLQSIFGHYFIMMTVLNMFLILCAIIIYKYWIPSHIGFMARQNSKQELNPSFDILLEVQKDIKELKEIIEGGKQ